MSKALLVICRCRANLPKQVGFIKAVRALQLLDREGLELDQPSGIVGRARQLHITADHAGRSKKRNNHYMTFWLSERPAMRVFGLLHFDLHLKPHETHYQTPSPGV